MPRKTRAAMRAEAEALNVEAKSAAVDVEYAPSTPTKVDRSPLADIDSNSVDGGVSTNEAEQQPEAEDLKASKRSKSTKGKKGKGGKKSTKGTEVGPVEDNIEQAVEETAETQAEAGAEDESAEAAAGHKKRGMTIYDKLEAIVTTPPTRHTRSRSAKDGIDDQTPSEPELQHQEQKVLLTHQPSPAAATPADDVQSSIPDLSSHEPNSSSQLESQEDVVVASSLDVPQQHAEVHTEVNAMVVPAESLTQPRAEDSIDAIDAMEDEFEKVNRMIPQVDITSPEKPAKAPTASKEGLAGAKFATAKMTEAFKARKAAATTSSSATSKKPITTNKPAVPRPGAPSNHDTGNGFSRSMSKHSSTNSAASSRKASTSEEAKDGKTTDYLASRRRPISMHFPTPPPPAKSAKAPTKSTFTLPGEAVAAKLKAAREERLKREEEELRKRREFKARPVRNSIAPVAVKPTAASRARESLMHGSEQINNKENAPLRRSGSVNTASTNKRASTLMNNTASKRASVAIVPGSTNPSTFSKSLHTTAAPKRSSMIAANTSKPRTAPNFAASTSAMASSASTAASTSGTTASSTSTNPVAVRNSYVAGKGREIFNRDRVEKERREQERKEKEEAAKKARLAAAERGRQASREWAEKAKAKKEAEAAARAANAQSGLQTGAVEAEVEHARLKAL